MHARTCVLLPRRSQRDPGNHCHQALYPQDKAQGSAGRLFVPQKLANFIAVANLPEPRTALTSPPRRSPFHPPCNRAGSPADDGLGRVWEPAPSGLRLFEFVRLFCELVFADIWRQLSSTLDSGQCLIFSNATKSQLWQMDLWLSLPTTPPHSTGTLSFYSRMVF